MYDIQVSAMRLPMDVLSALSVEEAKGAAKVSDRKDTVSIWVKDKKGKLVGYIVFGWDQGDMVSVYYARALIGGLGPLMMKQLFGVTQVLGAPMRVHAESLREVKAKARMFGANFAQVGEDADGIMMGVFDRV